MNELRDKVAKALFRASPYASIRWKTATEALAGEFLAAADVVLAIPEIAEALVISEGMNGDFRDYLLRRGRWAGVPADAGYV